MAAAGLTSDGSGQRWNTDWQQASALLVRGLGVKPWSGLWVLRAFECSGLVIADYGGELKSGC